MVPPLPSRSSVALVICLSFLASLVCAAPLNDNFAVRLTLNDSVTSTASNVDGTLEGSEPIPAGYDSSSYQSTIWWQWKPATPNPTQWYEVSTVGSTASGGGTLNTVLAIWTGTDYTTPLALVHVNDEAVNDDGTRSSVSRIRFLASSSVTYKISVASRNTTRGTVSLLTLPVPNPFSLVTEPASPFFFPPITFSPSPANVASTMTMTVDFRLSSTKEISSGLFTLYTPANAVLATATVSGASNRISGSVSSGVYRVTLTIPQGSPVGSCRWGLVVTNPGASPPATSLSSSFGWDGTNPLSVSTLSSVTLFFDSYAAWLTANTMTGTSSVRDADYDGDGVKNLVEFAFGSDPKLGTSQFLTLSGNTITSVGLPSITTTGTGDQTRLRVQFLRRLNDSTISYLVQFSDDLVNWTNAANAPSVIGSNSTFEAVSVDDSVVLPAKTLRFGRVRVTQ